MLNQIKKNSIYACKRTIPYDFMDWYDREWQEIVSKLKSSGRNLQIPIVPEKN